MTTSISCGTLNLDSPSILRKLKVNLFGKNFIAAIIILCGYHVSFEKVSKDFC